MCSVQPDQILSKKSAMLLVTNHSHVMSHCWSLARWLPDYNIWTSYDMSHQLWNILKNTNIQPFLYSYQCNGVWLIRKITRNLTSWTLLNRMVNACRPWTLVSRMVTVFRLCSVWFQQITESSKIHFIHLFCFWMGDIIKKNHGFYKIKYVSIYSSKIYMY